MYRASHGISIDVLIPALLSGGRTITRSYDAGGRTKSALRSCAGRRLAEPSPADASTGRTVPGEAVRREGGGGRPNASVAGPHQCRQEPEEKQTT